jgi:mono/diheme cytochrome c family protein
MRQGLLLLAVCVLTATTGCSKLSALLPPDIPDNTPVKEVRWLDQNWSADERFWFHHASQGTSTLPVPYAWFLALEQPELSLFGEPGLLSDPAYLSRFGFIASPKQLRGQANPPYNPDTFYGNPDGLPVGFTKVPAYPDPTTGDMLPDQIGFACAACHTGHMEYKGTSIRVDGAPAITDLGKFRTVLGLTLVYTRYVPGRFGRFADRVLGEAYTPQREAALEETLKNLLALGQQIQTMRASVAEQNVEEGFTRLDALNRIGTRLFFNDLLPAKSQGFDARVNLAANNAPVNFPHIWDTSWFLWVQYDASIMQPMVRNVGEALGVSARINLVNPAGNLYKSSVPVQELYAIEQLLAGENPHADEVGFKGLRSPAWPGDILGAIDQEAKDRGRALYQKLCQGCHLGSVNEAAFWTHKRWQAPNAAGERYLDLFESRIAKIGTDPAQATILSERLITLPAYLGIDGTPDETGKTVETTFGAALAAVVEKTTTAWYDEHNTSASDRDKLNGYRPNQLQTKNIYKARPLNGIWATPPFLHNGSVPTMYALLSPVEERPKTFCLGSREYDPVHMGYTTACAKGTFQLDTSIPGNLNTGHENKDGPTGNSVIGRGLSHEERLDLIGFLKSL